MMQESKGKHSDGNTPHLLHLMEDRNLNKHRLKSKRISCRLMAVSDEKTADILKKRYDNHMRMAVAIDRDLQPLLEELTHCHTEWDPAVNKAFSEENDESSGLGCMSITIYPADANCIQSIKRLLSITEANRKWERAINRRVSIRTLRKNENVQAYFDRLRTDKDFLMVYGVYRSAVNILANELLDDTAVSKRTMEEIGKVAIAGVGDPVKFFVESFNEKPYLRIFFEISDGMLLPKRIDGRFRLLSSDELISRVFLEARERDILFDYIFSASSHAPEC